MNKKKILLFVIIPLVVVCIIALIIFAPTFTMTLSREGCLIIFGVTPEEFLETELEFYSETGDFRTHALVNKNGKLVCSVSRAQLIVWKKYLSDFSEYPEKEPFVISSDYKKLDVYISSSIAPNSKEYDAIWQEAEKIFTRLWLLQCINFTPSSSTYVTYTVIDKDTGEILAQRRYKV